MYEIFLSDKAQKQLTKLNKKERERIGSVFERIKIRPNAFVKRLIGTPHYSLRVGNYRVILDIKHKDLIILIIKIGHRKKIYK